MSAINLQVMDANIPAASDVGTRAMIAIHFDTVQPSCNARWNGYMMAARGRGGLGSRLAPMFGLGLWLGSSIPLLFFFLRAAAAAPFFAAPPLPLARCMAGCSLGSRD